MKTLLLVVVVLYLGSAAEGNGVPRSGLKLSEGHKQVILDRHNYWRRRVQPTATNMGDLQWSTELENEALKRAVCGERFNKHFDVYMNGQKDKYGENLNLVGNTAAHETTDSLFRDAIDDFFMEGQYYNYWDGKCSGLQCAHYTQGVWANTKKLGCAYAMDCPEGTEHTVYLYTMYIVCLYDPAGNIIGQKPYETSQTEEELTLPQGSDKRILTIGGLGNGEYCDFPFTHLGEKRNECAEGPGGDLFCYTMNGAWGYCIEGELCKDTGDCELYKDLYGDYFKDQCKYEYLQLACKESCGMCGNSQTCPLKECQNDGSKMPRRCGCNCRNGWTGKDCRSCGIEQLGGCKNGGKYNKEDCSCDCPNGFGGHDCTITDSTEVFSLDGMDDYKCEFLPSAEYCGCQRHAATLLHYCPVTCEDEDKVPVEVQLLMKKLREKGCSLTFEKHEDKTMINTASFPRPAHGFDSVDACRARCGSDWRCHGFEFANNECYVYYRLAIPTPRAESTYYRKTSKC